MIANTICIMYYVACSVLWLFDDVISYRCRKRYGNDNVVLSDIVKPTKKILKDGKFCRAG